MLERYVHALNADYVRIARIQIKSPLRDQTLYPDHYYKITVRLNSIFEPENPYYYRENFLKIYASTAKRHYFTNNSTLFFTKYTADGDNVYLDVAITKESYYTSFDVKVDTVDEGSVTLCNDVLSSGDIANYGAIECQNTGIALDAKKPIYLKNGSNFSILVPKSVTRITSLTNNVMGYVFADEKINYDNDDFTVTVDNTNTYYNYLTITSKLQGWFFIET